MAHLVPATFWKDVRARTRVDGVAHLVEESFHLVEGKKRRTIRHGLRKVTDQGDGRELLRHAVLARQRQPVIGIVLGRVKGWPARHLARLLASFLDLGLGDVSRAQRMVK